jgi:hypothetical protein
MSLLAMSLPPGKLPKNKHQTRFLWKPGFSSPLVANYLKGSESHVPQPPQITRNKTTAH